MKENKTNTIESLIDGNDAQHKMITNIIKNELDFSTSSKNIEQQLERKRNSKFSKQTKTFDLLNNYYTKYINDPDSVESPLNFLMQYSQQLVDGQLIKCDGEEVKSAKNQSFNKWKARIVLKQFEEEDIEFTVVDKNIKNARQLAALEILKFLFL
jgi:hypothetical protein